MQENQDIISKASSLLLKHEIDLNIYVDSYHLYLFLNQIIKFSQNQKNNIFNHFKLGECPNLKIDERVYSELIMSFIGGLNSIVTNKIKNKFNDENSDKRLISSSDFFISTYRKKFKDTNNVFETIVKRLNYIENNEKIPTHKLELNRFVTFFIGGDVDILDVTNVLKRKLRHASDLQTKKRIEEYIQYYQTNNINKFSNKQIVDMKNYKAFKNSLQNFDDNWNNLVSETYEGRTLFDIHDKSNFMIRFREKAVDSKLIITVLDDLTQTKNKTIFSIITNDSDMQPLFEKIVEKNDLYWLWGNIEGKASRALSEVILEQNKIDLRDVYFGKEKTHVIHTSVWETQCEEASKDKTYPYWNWENIYSEILRYSQEREDRNWEVYDEIELERIYDEIKKHKDK